MNPSWRKPFGIFAILALITAWAVLIASCSQYISMLPGWAQMAVYAVAGIIWIWLLPLKPLLAWMETGKWRE